MVGFSEAFRPNEGLNNRGQIAFYAQLANGRVGIYRADLAATKVIIDIKPGNRKDRVNPHSRGKIDVAILSTNTADGDPLDFDALQVEPQTVRFGPNEAEAIRYRVKDIDRDGDYDLVFRFRIPKTGIECGDTEAKLTGQTWCTEPILFGLRVASS